MAVTKGHGNPKWTRDETILALELYHDCGVSIPSSSDERVQELSALLRSIPIHARSARNATFRNPDGVAFKLQNLRSVATGKGLSNTSTMDRQVWEEFGSSPEQTKALANQIRSSIQSMELIKEDSWEHEEFSEGKLLTELHVRRERSSRVRKTLLDKRKKSGALICEICECDSATVSSAFAEAMFEVHHILPLSASQARKTKLSDLALLCANCHRLIHRAIALKKRWLSVAEARDVIFGSNTERL